MFSNKELSIQNLDGFNFIETKKNIKDYFKNYEKLEWEWKKLNGQKGLTANYDFSVEPERKPYTPIRKDEFNISSKEQKEEQLKKCVSDYYWAKSVLSEKEQLYIKECFINRKSQIEIVGLLGYIDCDCHGFRQLRRSAIYKFADFLDLVVGKN